MSPYIWFLAFAVLVGVVGGFCAVLEWHDRRRFDAHVDAALAVVRAPEAVAREEAAWIDAAVTLMRGWVEHRESGRPVLAWHRLLGDVSVSVGRAA